MRALRALVLVLVALAFEARAAAPDLGSDAQRESGKKLYLKYCAQCHGDAGDGAGYAAPHLLPLPRNFTTGKFKVRTTPSGALPTTEDLKSIIRRGMPYSSMPAWPGFSDDELRDLAYHVKTFSAEFANPESNLDPIDLPKAPASTKESVEKGKQLYVDSGCVRCHGNLGRGDGPSAPTLVDDLGHPIRPADLTEKWTFRGGGAREDVFRTMSTGLNGTPMPSFLEALKPEDRWAITDFIDSLGPEGAGYANLLVVRHVDEPIDLAKGAAAFASAPSARFAIVGQITEPGRSFHPPATAIEVQAVYDSESIAFLLRWHDMSAEKGGHNDPALPVPIEEEEQSAAAPAPAGEGGGGVWGEEAAPAAAEADSFAEETTAAAPASEFSDAVALQLPAAPPSGARKPYFIFGDAQNAVDLWFFDLARPEPQQFTGKGSADIAPNDTGEVAGTATYDQGEWSVVFKRALRPTTGVAFNPGQFMPLAFSIWDGHTRERGNKRGLTVWYHLYLAPETVESPIVPMVQTGLLVLAAELVAVFWIRRRFGSRSERVPGARPVPEGTSST